MIYNNLFVCATLVVLVINIIFLLACIITKKTSLLTKSIVLGLISLNLVIYGIFYILAQLLVLRILQ